MRPLLIAVMLAVFSAAAGAEDSRTGSAAIDVSLDGAGRVLEANVVKAPTPLVDPIESWVRTTIFEPAVVDGQAVSSTTSVLLQFSLDEVEDGYALKFLSYTTGPRLVRASEPRYPRRNLEKGLGGWVRLKFTVSPTGDVEDASVVESSDQSFDKAALQAIERFKYKAPTVDGQGIRTVMEQTIEFKVDR
ncbi:MAG: energy transducer TonB [Gammaproteobacteria bacterium]|jgi:TonB family protein